MGWVFSVAILVFNVAGCYPLPYLVFFVAPEFCVAVPKVFFVAASVFSVAWCFVLPCRRCFSLPNRRFLLPGVFCCRVECFTLLRLHDSLCWYDDMWAPRRRDWFGGGRDDEA